MPRTPWFGNDDGKLAANVEVPEGNYDPVLGMSYVQIAREGLGYQKSQTGGGMIPKAGALSILPIIAMARSCPSEEKENSFFDGIDTSLMGIATLAKGGKADFLLPGLKGVNSSVEAPWRIFRPAHPEKIAPQLAQGYKETEKLIEQVKAQQVFCRRKVQHDLRTGNQEGAVQQRFGGSAGAVRGGHHGAGKRTQSPLCAMFIGDPDTTRVVIPGQKLGVKVHVVSQSPVAVTLKNVEVKAADGKNWGIKSAEQTRRPLADGKAGGCAL